MSGFSASVISSHHASRGWSQNNWARLNYSISLPLHIQALSKSCPLYLPNTLDLPTSLRPADPSPPRPPAYSTSILVSL